MSITLFVALARRRRCDLRVNELNRAARVPIAKCYNYAVSFLIAHLTR